MPSSSELNKEYPTLNAINKKNGTSSPTGLSTGLARLPDDEGDGGGRRPFGHRVLKVAELLMLDVSAHALEHPFLRELVRGEGGELQQDYHGKDLPFGGGERIPEW